MRTNIKIGPTQRGWSKMNRILVPITLVAILFSGCAKDDLSNLGTSTSFELNSVHTEKNYKVDVFYPDDEFPSSEVPVVVILDGFWYKKMAAEIATELSEEATIPKCLLVSIDYVGGGGVYERFEDLVYPYSGTDEVRLGDKFYQFLTEELMPQIESQYPTDTTRRTIFGHSLGGYFMLRTLVGNPNQPFFQNRIAASCSIGMDDNELFVLESTLADTISDINQNLLIGCGTLVGSAPIMHQQFFENLQSRNYPNLNVAFETYSKTHATDAYPSLKNGLRHVFN